MVGNAASVDDAKAVLRAICDLCSGIHATPFRRTSPRPEPDDAEHEFDGEYD